MNVSETLGDVEERAILLSPDFASLDKSCSPDDMISYGRFVSKLYAPDDLDGVMPTRTILKEAFDADIGPHYATLAKVISISALQKALGFVNTQVLRSWTDQEWIDNGIWLSHMIGTPKHPIMPSIDIVAGGAHARVAPNYSQIADRFNGIEEYQDRLGFVSQATLRRWTDQEWIDNGIWLSHMIGSSGKPIMPKRKDLQVASAQNITPPLRFIYEKFGSLPNYQRALGFDPYEHTLDYTNWSPQQYIDNGIWMSHILGTPEHPVMPTVPVVRIASNHGLTPPPKAIAKRHGRSFEVYQDKLGFVTAATIKRWTHDDWIDNGVWLAQITGSHEQPANLTDELINTGRNLNISPTRLQIESQFLGGVEEYRRAVNRALYGEIPLNQWSKYELLDQLVQQHGIKNVKQLDVALQAQDVTEIVELLGGRRKTLNRLGLVNYTDLSTDELITFGVIWASEHEGRAPTQEELRQLASTGKGPSVATTSRIIGEYYSYQEMVEVAYKEYDILLNSLREQGGTRLDTKIAKFVLRDFKVAAPYAQQAQVRMTAIKNLYYSGGRNMSRLIDIFSRSRTTLAWNIDDFVFFGLAAIGTGETVMDNTKTLTQLNRLGLTPYLDEVGEMFGSLGRFVKYIQRTSESGDQRDI